MKSMRRKVKLLGVILVAATCMTFLGSFDAMARTYYRNVYVPIYAEPDVYVDVYVPQIINLPPVYFPPRFFRY